MSENSVSQDNLSSNVESSSSNNTTTSNLSSNNDNHNRLYFRGFQQAVRRVPAVYHEETSFVRSFVRNLIWFSIPLGIFYLMQRYMVRNVKGEMKGLMSMLTEPQRNFKVSTKNITFRDVIGIPEAKEEVQQYVEFLKDPKKFSALGARMPRGCLLTGQPGTGKTLLAKAVAGEANVSFFSCTGSDFIEVYSGSGPKMVRKLFEEARQSAPAIVFIDEIDAIGTRGQKSSSGSSSEENRTINQLLTELDGITSSQHTVIVFAATNFVENIDQAVLREGRFDRKVDLPLPDGIARKELFEFYLKKIATGDPKGFAPAPPAPVVVATNEGGQTPPPPPPPPQAEPLPPNPDGDNATIAKIMADLTPGLSPATIAAVVNEAALGAAAQKEPIVRLSHLKDAIDDVTVGKKHRSTMTNKASGRIALHECGHTILAWVLPEQRGVLKVSIIPRGHAAGFTQQPGMEASDPMTHMTFFTNLCVLLGGRCAELTQHTDLTTGAVDDLQRATEQCTVQFLSLGMSPKVGHLAFNQQDIGKGRLFVSHSAALQQRVEAESKCTIELAYEVTKFLLKKYEKELTQLTEELTTKKQLDVADIERILGPRPKTSPIPKDMLKRIESIYVTAASMPPVNPTPSIA